jgi:lysophospholipase L1-like esterase
VALALYAGYQAVRMRRLIAVGRGLAAHAVRFEQPREGGVPRILVVGDSTAVGTGVTDPRGSIAGRFGQEFPRADIRNAGINGLTALELARDFPAPPRTVDLVMIQIGANDIVQGTPMAEFTRSLASVFDQAKKTGAHVVALHSGNIGLAPLFPWPISAVMRARTLRYGAEYRRIAAEKGVIYVELFHERADDPFRGDLRFYGADQFHLSEEGYAEWYWQTRRAMEQAGISL